jgi:hypothetical protein
MIRVRTESPKYDGEQQAPSGRSYQSRINAVLRGYVRSQRQGHGR